MLETSRLLSALSNVRHGFSTRPGGVSSGAFSSLNLGRDTGDDPANVVENRARFVAALQDGLQLAQADQVHGVELIRADRGGNLGTADGLLCAAPGVAIGVRTADCAPVLIAVASGSRASEVAAVHAGWRGATARIVPLALEVLRAPLSSLRVAIGPTIGMDAFEVGEEVIDAARVSLGGEDPPMKRSALGRAHLDLRGLLVRQLLLLGLSSEQIELVGGSTVEDPALYFSHRRDRGITGRHLSAIALVP